MFRQAMKAAKLAESLCFGPNARMSGEALKSSVGLCNLTLVVLSQMQPPYMKRFYTAYYR